MKKFLPLICLLTILSLTLTACSSDEPETTPSLIMPEENQEQAEDQDDGTDTAGNEAVDADAFLQEVADGIMDEMAEFTDMMADMMEINVYARGNALVMSYKYVIDVSEVENIEDNLAAEMEGQKAAFDSYLQVLKLGGLSNPQLVVEYLDMNGEEIYTEIFE